ncbi:MAG: helix-turn-helix transcriptional regulator [Clostridiales bacterium]|nr:helix-turn-helix transcriptional regulator [Clostridiales bacterium]
MKIITRLSVVLVYIAILLYVADFRFSLLWDPQGILLVLVGTLLLTASSYKRGTDRTSLCYSIRFHSMSAAYLTTFIGLYTRLVAGKIPLNNVVPTVAMSCRPLLYGFIIYLLFTGRTGEPSRDTASAESQTDHQKTVTAETSKEKEITFWAGKTESSTEEDFLANWEKLKQKLTSIGLTKREIEVTFWVKKGLSNKEIAEKLFISDTTVKKHISNIFDKLELTNREQLRQL